MVPELRPGGSRVRGEPDTAGAGAPRERDAPPHSRTEGRQEVRAVESPGAAGPGRDGAPRHVGVRAVPRVRHQAGDALPVRRPAGRRRRGVGGPGEADGVAGGGRPRHRVGRLAAGEERRVRPIRRRERDRAGRAGGEAFRPEFRRDAQASRRHPQEMRNDRNRRREGALSDPGHAVQRAFGRATRNGSTAGTGSAMEGPPAADERGSQVPPLTRGVRRRRDSNSSTRTSHRAPACRR